MKLKIFLLLITGLLTTTSFAQNDKEDIKKTVEAYFKTVEQNDYAKTLDYVYPKFFEYFPKEELLKNIKNIKTDTILRISIKNPMINSISKVVEVKNVKYALVNYSYTMTIDFIDNEKTDEKEGFSYMSFLHEMYKEMFGVENVKYDAENTKFIIYSSHEMFAINDPEYKVWKFLENNTESKSLLEEFIPEKVLKELQ